MCIENFEYDKTTGFSTITTKKIIVVLPSGQSTYLELHLLAPNLMLEHLMDSFIIPPLVFLPFRLQVLMDWQMVMRSLLTQIVLHLHVSLQPLETTISRVKTLHLIYQQFQM